MKLLVVPLMVRVFSFVHTVIRSIGEWTAKLETATVSYFQMTLRAKQDAVTERISASVFPWLPMVRLPAPACAFGSVAPNEFFATSPAKPPLPIPSLLYSVSRKGHTSTSRRIVNGWVDKGNNTRVLFQNGKSTNMTIVALPFMYQGKSKRPVYDIYHRGRYLGYAWSLGAAKSRAETYLKKMRCS